MIRVAIELQCRPTRRHALVRRAAAFWLFLRARRTDFDEAACFERIARHLARCYVIEARDAVVQ